jgi:hypothetical protein
MKVYGISLQYTKLWKGGVFTPYMSLFKLYYFITVLSLIAHPCSLVIPSTVHVHPTLPLITDGVTALPQ